MATPAPTPTTMPTATIDADGQMDEERNVGSAEKTHVENVPAREQAQRLRALARVRELERVAHQLGSMLEYFEQISTVNTDASEAYVAAPTPAAPLRDDVPLPGLERAGAFANAPDANPEAGLFRVPRVIGG